MVEVGFMVFALFVVGLVVYPLRRTLGLSVMVGGVTMLLLVCAYLQFGNRAVWRTYLAQQAKLEQAKQILKQFKSKDEVIQALKVRLDKTKKSAKGWYLLGRLYASEGHWRLASDAFKEAHVLLPKKIKYFVEYGIALWQFDQQQMTPKTREVFLQILAEHPAQPDALMYLAMDAYLNHQNQKAIAYWERLLILVPADSKDAKMIREAILKAQRAKVTPTSS